MNLVLDSNIFISGLITPNGTISKLILTQIERLRSIDEEKVSISPYPFGEIQHFLCRG